MRELYHVTHWSNGASIAGSGLLSRNLLKMGEVKVKDISLEGPQIIRSQKRLGGRTIHDFVPTFFEPLNAMTSMRRDLADELLLLAIRPSVMLAPGAMVCDGNVAAPTTQAWSNVSGLPYFKWAVMRDHRNAHEDWKRIRQAEALIPDQVPVSYILRWYVRTNRLQTYLASLVPFDVQVRQDLFFRPGVSR